MEKIANSGVASRCQGDHAKGRTAETVPSDTVVKVLHRHHFSSKLQRMSVVATVKGENEKGEQLYILAKGSPEMVKTLLSPTEAVCDNWEVVVICDDLYNCLLHVSSVSCALSWPRPGEGGVLL